MRSKIEANEYKDYILGFIFYKFLSDKQVKFLKEKGMTDKELAKLNESQKDVVKFCQKSNGYFIAYEHLFSTWIEKDASKSFEIANVQDALNAFERLLSPDFKKLFENIFTTLHDGLKKLGESSGAQTKAVAALINLIKDIPMDGRQDYDVLGFIYEYLISNFAANAGKKAGEFYTPHEVSVMMSEIIAEHLKDRKKIEIYDPTSGSGSLLINIGKSVSKYISGKNKIKYFAQELKANTYNLTRMNLVMRGIDVANIETRNADTLEDDWPLEDPMTAMPSPLRVDAVVSNPPYSQNWDPDESKKNDPRYKSYGLAPKSKADYAFLLHDLYHLKADGIMTIVLPHGVLFRGDEEGEIRKRLIEQDNISAIIGLPPDIFFGTGIPTIVMVLRVKGDTEDGVLFVDASKGFVKQGKKNKLRACDIRRIVDTVVARKSVPKFSRLVTRDEIRENKYNLNIPRYVDSSDDPVAWDLYATMEGGIPNSEIDALQKYWDAFGSLRKNLFRSDDTPYSQIVEGEISRIASADKSVGRFRKQFWEAFNGFDEYLEERLIGNMMKLSVVQEERIIGDEIFRRLEKVKAIDPYDAYQALDDLWLTTGNDLEMLQEEGFDAVRKVDPNMVIKKKDGKDQEVQDGWVGHIIPFELAQRMLLDEDIAEIGAIELKLEEAGRKLEEIISEMSEEDKEKYLNDDNTAFNSKAVNEAVEEFFASNFKSVKVKKADHLKYLLENGSFEDGSLSAQLVGAAENLAKEKFFKSEIKEKRAALHQKTKETIEKLSDEDAKELLREKWIRPLERLLYLLPEMLVKELCDKVKVLGEKYAVTFADVESEIQKAQGTLKELVAGLTGDGFSKKALAEVSAAIGDGNLMAIKKIASGLFPQPGEKVPRIRFKEFDGEWKPVSIGSIFAERDARSSSGELLSVTMANGIIKACENGKRDNSSSDKSHYKVVRVGDVAYNSMRMWQGACGASKHDGIVSPAYTVMIPTAQIDVDFVEYHFKRSEVLSVFRRYSQGMTSDTWNLKFPMLSTISVVFPEYAEQQKIGLFFRSLDALIAASAKKVEKLRQVKASLLNEMFV